MGRIILDHVCRPLLRDYVNTQTIASVLSSWHLGSVYCSWCPFGSSSASQSVHRWSNRGACVGAAVIVGQSANSTVGAAAALAARQPAPQRWFDTGQTRLEVDGGREGGTVADAVRAQRAGVRRTPRDASNLGVVIQAYMLLMVSWSGHAQLPRVRRTGPLRTARLLAGDVGPAPGLPAAGFSHQDEFSGRTRSVGAPVERSACQIADIGLIQVLREDVHGRWHHPAVRTEVRIRAIAHGSSIWPVTSLTLVTCRITQCAPESRQVDTPNRATAPWCGPPTPVWSRANPSPSARIVSTSPHGVQGEPVRGPYPKRNRRYATASGGPGHRGTPHERGLVRSEAGGPASGSTPDDHRPSRDARGA